MGKEIISYKGFDSSLRCRGFQYEVGKDYEQEGNIKCCENGFHACEFPYDVFSYYAPGENSRYCIVTQSGEMDKNEGDSKVASSKIHIETEIGLDGIIKAGVKFILDKVNWKDKKATNTGYRSAATNTGDYSAATNTGDYSAATNTGDYSAATNTGYRSAATNTGDQSVAVSTGEFSTAKVSGKGSVAVVTGRDSKAAGALGDWIVLTERYDWKWNYQIKDVKAFMVDGEKIQPNTFYKLVDGEAVEAYTQAQSGTK